jgi:hypothetical protein
MIKSIMKKRKNNKIDNNFVRIKLKQEEGLRTIPVACTTSSCKKETKRETERERETTTEHWLRCQPRNVGVYLLRCNSLCLCHSI